MDLGIMELFMLVAISTGFFFTLRNLINKYVLANQMGAFAFFYFFTSISIISIPIISWTISPIVFPSFQSWLLIIFSSTAGFTGTLIFFYALTLGDVTTASPVLSIRPIFIAPLSFIFLNEFYGIEVIIWILLIVFGAILTSCNENAKIKDLLRNRTLGLLFTTTILWAMMNISSKPILQEMDNFNFIGWFHIFNAPLLLLLMPIVLNEREKNNLKKNWKPTLPYAIIANIFYYMSFVTMFYAMKFSVSLSESLIATQGVFTVILGFLISQVSPRLIAEKHTKHIYILRIIGAILILIGVFHILT